MPIPSHLMAKTEGLELDPFLSEWRWLVPNELKPTLVTAFGDVFLRDEADRIYFLDTLRGLLEEAANSQAQFYERCEVRDYRWKYFQSFVVGEMRRMHGELQEGECYSCDHPPTLGGQLEPEDFERTDLATHFSVLGQLHRQTRHLPEGTKIDRINIILQHEDTGAKSIWQRIFER